VAAATPLLDVRELAVAYGGIQAVKGIDLAVGAGELVCLIGANGAGKTTTLKGICGLQPVKSGTIRYAIYGETDEAELSGLIDDVLASDAASSG